jgi:hypothetical protein
VRIRRPGLALAAATLTAALLTAGCSGAEGGAEGADGAKDVATPAGLSVSVLQYRLDYEIRRIQIKVINDGADPVTVSAARLTSPAFTADAAWLSKDRADETMIAPGTATDLPALLAPTNCAGRPALTGSARIDLRLADGTIGRTAALPVQDPFGSIAKVHSQDCRRAAALAIADLTLVDPLRTTTRDGALLGLLDLKLTPTGAPGSLTVESIGSTTLLSPPAGNLWTVGRTVSAASGPQTVTLQLRAARCDPHAIAEDKRGTVLPLTVRMDGGESGLLSLPADPQLRRQIQSFVHDACGAG